MMWGGLLAVVRLATPLGLAGLGGLFSERAGKANIALEGMMLIGAFTCATVAAVSGSPWLGMLAAALAGLCTALVHLVAVIGFRVHALLSGIVVNLLAAAVTDFLYLITLDHIQDWSLAGSLGASHFLSLLFLALALLSHVFLFRTVIGLRWRAVGQSSSGARSLGVWPRRYQAAGILLSGILAGLGGSYLALQAGGFVLGMSAGRGFLALAALILANWRPWRLIVVCMILGGLSVIPMRMDGFHVPSQLLDAMPYLVALLVMAGLALKSEPPAGLLKEEENL